MYRKFFNILFTSLALLSINSIYAYDGHAQSMRCSRAYSPKDTSWQGVVFKVFQDKHARAVSPATDCDVLAPEQKTLFFNKISVQKAGRYFFETAMDDYGTVRIFKNHPKPSEIASFKSGTTYHFTEISLNRGEYTVVMETHNIEHEADKTWAMLSVARRGEVALRTDAKSGWSGYYVANSFVLTADTLEEFLE